MYKVVLMDIRLGKFAHFKPHLVQIFLNFQFCVGKITLQCHLLEELDGRKYDINESSSSSLQNTNLHLFVLIDLGKVTLTFILHSFF